jgi:hypothetical protein
VVDVVIADPLLVEELPELPVLLGDPPRGDLDLSGGLDALELA